MLTPETEAGSRRTSGTRGLLLVGALAVLIAFASSATAAVVVTGKQIKDNTITTQDLRNGGLRGLDVRDESLTQNDFATIVEGPRGPKGDRGTTGQGGSSGLVYVIEAAAIAKTSTKTWGAKCPTGTRVLSGGGSAATQGVAVLAESAPLDDAGSGWWVGIRNTTNATITGYAWALCVKA